MNSFICFRLGKDTLQEQLIQLVCRFDSIWFHYRLLQTSVISDKAMGIINHCVSIQHKTVMAILLMESGKGTISLQNKHLKC